MTVEPGFGGQSFRHELLSKIETIAGYINDRNYNCELEADGGVNAETGALLKKLDALFLLPATMCLTVTTVPLQ